MGADTKSVAFLWGAFGGALPTIAKLASTYVAVPTTPLPAIGLLLGVVLWAVVGGGVALTNTNYETRQAIFAGIAAPAIIASLISGATNPPGAKVSLLDISAYAQQPTGTTDDGAQAIVISPQVQGGLPRTTSIPVTAEVKNGDQSKVIDLGDIKDLSTPTKFTLPANTMQVFISGQAVKPGSTQTNIDLSVRTAPSNDLLWALGGPRKFEIQSLQVSPAKQ
ncbi:hypothetical protein [Mesorhizobium sp.]|uniref:hypothetical protein n=1 Tax=Mesorhizobium sp. TaxID=1871066 RepID=UPI0025E6B0B9|nr:hypothetical protein [Mesorhizobium sp.]